MRGLVAKLWPSLVLGALSWALLIWLLWGAI